MSANRKAVRHLLANLLRTAMTSAQTVYDHEPGDLGSASPIVVISSDSSDRPRLTFQGNQSTFYFNVDIYTLAAESATGTYSYADSADVVDDCEQQLATCVEANQENGSWNRIAYAGRSSPIEFGVFGADGIPRFRERIPLAVVVYA